MITITIIIIISIIISIPKEPNNDDDDTINICFRIQITSPNAVDTIRLTRRFYKTDKVMLLINFVESIDTLPYYDSIEITTSYPKFIIYTNTTTTITSTAITTNNNNDVDKTLSDLNLESNSIIWVSISNNNPNNI